MKFSLLLSKLKQPLPSSSILRELVLLQLQFYHPLIVVRKAVKLESVEVEEDMVAKLDTVNVGMRLQTPACREGQKAVEKSRFQKGTDQV